VSVRSLQLDPAFEPSPSEPADSLTTDLTGNAAADPLAVWRAALADEAAFERISPAYRYRELRAPLLLVHGTEDPRVDYEHTRRLVRLLSMDGRPPNLITLEGAGHGIADAAQRKQVWPAVARFLQDHLGVP